jgi:hypothetical protein
MFRMKVDIPSESLIIVALHKNEYDSNELLMTGTY